MVHYRNTFIYTLYIHIYTHTHTSVTIFPHGSRLRYRLWATPTNYYVIILQKGRQKSHSTDLMILRMKMSVVFFFYFYCYTAHSHSLTLKKKLSGYENIIETLFLTSL